MSNMEQWAQEDWGGGVNTLLAPDLIADNECQQLLNMLPKRGSSGVSLRKGFQPVYDNIGDDVYGVFIKRKTDNTRQLIACVNDNGTVKLNLYGELGSESTSETFTAVAKMVDIFNPRSYITTEGSGYAFLEKGTQDYWSNDGSLWDDGTYWSDPNYGYIDLTVDTYDTDTRITINTAEFIGRYPGSVIVYYKKSTDVSYTTLGTYTVGTPAYFTVTSANKGTYNVRVAVTDNATSGYSETGGILNGITRTQVGSAVLLKNLSAAPADFAGIWFSDWDANRFFFATEEDGLYTVDLDASPSAEQVFDKSASPADGMDAGYHYLVQHKGRLVMADPSSVTVHICGSSDAVNARWESWSGSSASSGGSVDVVPYGSYVKGLASTFSGILVFKESGVYLWSYGESTAPWDAANASIEPVIGGLGCVDHNTIVTYGGDTYFMGRTDVGTIGLWKYDGSNISEVSAKVPTIIDDIVDSGGLEDSMYGAIIDDYYILIAKSGLKRKVVAMFDTKSGAWVEVTSPDICSAFAAIGDPFVLLGGYDGQIYRYPGSTNVDGYGDPIEWKIVGKKINTNPTAECYWRNAWLDASADTPTEVTLELQLDLGKKLSSGEPMLVESYAADYWDDGSVWALNGADSVWGSTYKEDKYFQELGTRSYTAAYELSGESTDAVGINRIVIGYRDRRVRNVKYA